MLFRKEKIDEKTRIYHILGIKIKLVKKSVRISKMTKAKRDDALITLKCIRNLSAKINNVQTIVLGSSSARMGFIENDTSINLGIDAQDLYYSYKLLEKYISIIPNLKNVVLYFTVFAPGNNLEHSPLKYRSSYYSAYFDIPYRNKFAAIIDERIKLEERLIKNTKKFTTKLKAVPYDLMTEEHKILNPEHIEQKWIESWIKLNQKCTEIHYLEKILNLAKNNGCRVLIVNCPYAERAKEKLPEYSLLFKTSNEICKKYKNVQIYNAYSDDCYEKDDFRDLNHLSRSGAEKMTTKINEFLEDEL